MGIEKFSEQVRKYVKQALPDELAGANVCIANLDAGDGATRAILLVVRPWNNVATGFYLDTWHKKYSTGNATAESTAAAIINDRRLYNMAIW